MSWTSPASASSRRLPTRRSSGGSSTRPLGRGDLEHVWELDATVAPAAVAGRAAVRDTSRRERFLLNQGEKTPSALSPAGSRRERNEQSGKRRLLGGSLDAAESAVIAEDIDLFAPRPPDEDTGRPQVLLIVDNRRTGYRVRQRDGCYWSPLSTTCRSTGSTSASCSSDLLPSGTSAPRCDPWMRSTAALFRDDHNLHVSNDRAMPGPSPDFLGGAPVSQGSRRRVDAEATTGARKTRSATPPQHGRQHP